MSVGEILGYVSGVGGCSIAGVALWLNQRRSQRADDDEALKRTVALMLVPVTESIASLSARQAAFDAKTEMMVDMWREIRRDMATILHSPDPARAHVDRLMDMLKRDDPFTEREETQLRRILKQIMHYEPGHPTGLGFTVRDGEQVQAAFLLRSLDYAPVRRRKE